MTKKNNNTCEITGKAHGEFANGKDEFAYNNFMVSRYLVTKSHLVISVFDSKI